MGVHKTVNGAYRYRYAPFLMSTYYVMGRSPLALPLGELSPQVTERVLQPFSNDKINLCTHITEIPVAHGVSSPCEAAGHFLIGCCLLVWSLVALSVLAALGHLSQGERQDVFPGTSPLRALAALGHLSQGERQDVFPGTSPLQALATLGLLSQGERRGMPARYTERCIEVRPLSVRQIGVYCSIR